MGQRLHNVSFIIKLVKRLPSTGGVSQASLLHSNYALLVGAKFAELVP